MLGDDCVWEGDRPLIALESGEVTVTREVGEEESGGGIDRAGDWLDKGWGGDAVCLGLVPGNGTTLFSSEVALNF